MNERLEQVLLEFSLLRNNHPSKYNGINQGKNKPTWGYIIIFSSNDVRANYNICQITAKNS